MSVLDEHNRRHTFGNSLGLPTTAVGVSAQMAIDAQKRLVEGGTRSGSPGRELNGRDYLIAAMISGAITLLAAFAAYAVGGIGAVAIGLIAFAAGMFGVAFTVAALITFAKSGAAMLWAQARAGSRESRS